MQRDQSNGKSRKPWDGVAGAPSGPKRSVEQFMEDLWTNRPSAIRAHPRRILTKTGLAGRIKMSKPAFNKYYASAGARWPFPGEDHLVYVVRAADGILLWLAPTVCDVLHCEREDVIGLTVSQAFRGGEDLAVTAPEISEIGRRLREHGEDELEYSTYLVRWDDGAHVPVSLMITYGEGFDVFFVDAMITGEIDLSYARSAQLPLKPDDLGQDMFNVDPSIVYTVRRGEPGSGKTGTFLEHLGYRS